MLDESLIVDDAAEARRLDFMETLEHEGVASGENGGDSEETRNEKMEREVREKIAGRLSEIGLRDEVEELNDLIYDTDIVDDANKSRIVFSRDEYRRFMDICGGINEKITVSENFLSSYVEFSKGTPNFENLRNILFGLQDFIKAQNRRGYNRTKFKRERKHYFLWDDLTSHVEELGFVLRRIEGALFSGECYILDSEYMKEETVGGMGGDFGGNYPSGGYPNQMMYGSPQEQFGAMPNGKRGGVNLQKFVINPPRDFGDGVTKE